MRTWFAFCALLLVAIAGANLVDTVRRVPMPARSAATEAGDVVVRHERRLAGVRAALQAEGARGLVGYASDLAPEELTASDMAMQEYFLTQFVVAPWVLDARPAECAWVIGNYRARPRAERVPAGFRVVRDFGEGVLLLRKEAP